MSVHKLAGAAALAFFLCGAAQQANAACVAVNTVAKLRAIQNNLAGDYCLTADIDLSSVANFTPLGGSGTPFTGLLNGRNHVIRNLKISSGGDFVGLFGDIAGGRVQNLTLINVQIQSSGSGSSVGALAGTLELGAKIINVHVESGSVACTADCNDTGGFAGTGRDIGTTISHSSTAARVTRLENGAAGGFMASAFNITVQNSFATGSVTCGDFGFCAGFVGSTASATYIQSYASGTVKCGNGGFCSGFAGSAAGNTFRNVYATSNTLYDTSVGNPFTASFSGSAAGGSAENLFAAGANESTGSASMMSGGLFGSQAGVTITNGYWDTETTGQATSVGGTGLTTDQLQAALPVGFSDTVWGISPGQSYPFLLNVRFKSTLATLVAGVDLYTFLPLAQLEKSNYQGSTVYIDEASLATCYTMIARAVGEQRRQANLRNIAIDRFFWNDAAITALWRGPVKTYVELGAVRAIPAAANLRQTVIGQMRNGKVVLLRGTYRQGGTNRTAWMLATSFTRGENNAPDAIFANDPFTGRQITIDPQTKKVISPAPFPLRQFTIDRYQTVSIKSL